MKRVILFTALLALTLGCSSSQRLQVIPPEITILPLEFAPGRPESMGSFSMTVPVTIANKSGETLKLERIELTSIGTGAYAINPATTQFSFDIPPSRRAVAEVWVQVTATPQETVGTPDGSIHLRGVAYFRTGEYSFRRVFVQRMRMIPGDQRAR